MTQEDTRVGMIHKGQSDDTGRYMGGEKSDDTERDKEKDDIGDRVIMKEETQIATTETTDWFTR